MLKRMYRLVKLQILQINYVRKGPNKHRTLEQLNVLLKLLVSYKTWQGNKVEDKYLDSLLRNVEKDFLYNLRVEQFAKG